MPQQDVASVAATRLASALSFGTALRQTLSLVAMVAALLVAGAGCHSASDTPMDGAIAHDARTDDAPVEAGPDTTSDMDASEGPRLVRGPEPFTTGLLSTGEAQRWVYEDASMVCPDGLPSRFHVVAPATKETNQPLVLVLHGGCFDFVEAGGQHYAAPLNKLTRKWAECKLRDFLGEAATECEDPEENAGAIVAALVRANAVAVLPVNCFGDIWHGTGYEDPVDGFPRLGLSLARKAMTFVEKVMTTDPKRRFAWGTSAGAHGIAEVVITDKSFSRVLADSPPDYLPGAYNDPAYAPAKEGLRRVFEGDGSAEHVGSFSLAHAVSNNGLRQEVLYLYSCNDTVVPPSQSEPAAKAILTHYENPAAACVVHAAPPNDPSAPDYKGHVFSNANLKVSTTLATWLLEGVRPNALCETSFHACP